MSPAVNKAVGWTLDKKIPIVFIFGVLATLFGQYVIYSNFQLRTDLTLNNNNSRITRLEDNQTKILDLIKTNSDQANIAREKLNENYIRLNEQFSSMQKTMQDNVNATVQVRDELINIKKGR